MPLKSLVASGDATDNGGGVGSGTAVGTTGTGGAGIVGVNVELAVIPVESVTTYVSEVFVPGVAFASATNVTTPVAWLSV